VSLNHAQLEDHLNNKRTVSIRT